MKMRHKAQAGDPKDKNKHVPIDQKLHLKVRALEKGDEERIFWFNKVSLLRITTRRRGPLTDRVRQTIIAGRALDMLSTHFGVSSDKEVRLADLLLLQQAL